MFLYGLTTTIIINMRDSILQTKQHQLCTENNFHLITEKHCTFPFFVASKRNKTWPNERNMNITSNGMKH